MARKTRRRTNQHGLTSDAILEHLRHEAYPGYTAKRRGETFYILRKATKDDPPLRINQAGIWQAVGEFDQYRRTAKGTITSRP
jgi:hypothetical protein